MIKNLTKEQEEKIVEYKNKWIKNNLYVKKTNKIAVEQICRNLYKSLNLKEPTNIIWVRSPKELLITVLNLQELPKGYSEFDKAFIEQIHELKNIIEYKIQNDIRMKIQDGLKNNIKTNLLDKIYFKISEEIRKMPNSEKLLNIGSYCHQYTNQIPLFDYVLEVLKINNFEKLLPLIELTKETSWYLLHDDIAIICENPIEINNLNNIIIKWPDNYIYNEIENNYEA